MGVRNYSPRGTLHLTRRLWMDGRQPLPYKLREELPLALIGNASGHSFGAEQNLDPRRFR